MKAANDPLDRKKIFWMIEKAIPEKGPTPPALPEDRQTLFTYLCNLNSEQFKQVMKEWHS